MFENEKEIIFVHNFYLKIEYFIIYINIYYL